MEQSTCLNSPGTYKCFCDRGYKEYGSKCVGQLAKPNLIYVFVAGVVTLFLRDIRHKQIRTRWRYDKMLNFKMRSN